MGQSTWGGRGRAGLTQTGVCLVRLHLGVRHRGVLRVPPTTLPILQLFLGAYMRRLCNVASSARCSTAIVLLRGELDLAGVEGDGLGRNQRHPKCVETARTHGPISRLLRECGLVLERR